MELPESPPPGLEALAGADIAMHGHLPVAAAYCRRLGLAELVDKMVPTRMRLRPGAAVQAMVLDTLPSWASEPRGSSGWTGRRPATTPLRRASGATTPPARGTTRRRGRASCTATARTVGPTSGSS